MGGLLLGCGGREKAKELGLVLLNICIESMTSGRSLFRGAGARARLLLARQTLRRPH